jgi:hypothetical protein
MSLGDLKATVETRHARLDLLHPFLPASARLRLQGRLAVHAQAHLGLFPFEMRSLNGEAAAADFGIRGPEFELAGGQEPLRLAWSATQGHDRVATLTGALNLVRPLAAAVHDLEVALALVARSSGREDMEVSARAALSCGPPWEAEVQRLWLKASGRLEKDGWPRGRATLEAAGRLGRPLPLTIDRLALTAEGGPERIEVDGDFVVSAEDPALGNVRIVPASVSGTLSGRLHHLSRWQAHLAATPSRTLLDLAAGGLRMRFSRPRVEIDLSGDGGMVDYAARFRSRDGRLEPGPATIAWPELKADVSGRLALSDPTGGADARFGIQMLRPGTTGGEWNADSRQVSLQGRLKTGQRPTLAAELRLDGGRFAWPGQRLAAEAIALRLPLQWPAVNPAAGDLRADQVGWRGLHPGRLRGTVRQKGAGLVLDGTLQDICIEGLGLKLAAAAGLTEGGIDARLETILEPWSPAAPIDLGRLLPAAAGLSADGQAAFNAWLALKAGRLESRARLRLADASLTAPDKNSRLTGIAADVELVDLIALRSAPGQALHLDRAELGGILLSDAAIQFQIEGPRQMLLEKGAFGWCGGRVFAEAMRFSPGMDDYELTLFCDRLNLARILRQLGGLEAEGDGTVNGRIPLHYRQGRLRFNDGFLYSSPGVGGKIRMSGIERLYTGIPPQTLEYAQLALAAEALNDYDYQWAKVGLDSQGGQLALRLEFDGKPAQPLPFVYREELGRFVRVGGDAPGSRFQGIRLDVNLKLPLDEILQYGGLIRSFE